MLPTFDFINVIRQAAKGILSTLASPVAICTAFSVTTAAVVASLTGFAVSNYIASIDISFELPTDSVGITDLCLYVFSPDDLLRVARLMLSVIPAFFTFCVTAATTYMAALWIYRFAFASRSATREAIT